MGKKNKYKQRRKEARKKKKHNQGLNGMVASTTATLIKPEKNKKLVVKVKLSELAKPYNLGKYFMLKIMVKEGTQEAFSEALGIDVSEIYALCDGKKISEESYAKVKAHLGLTESDISNKIEELGLSLKERISTFKNATVPEEKLKMLVNLKD